MFAKFFKSCRNSSSKATRKHCRTRRPRFERLEHRELMTAVPTIALTHPAAAVQAGAYSPVNEPLFRSTGPSFQDVQQGAAGDCWLLASLASVAAKDPAMIKGMFSAPVAAMENGTRVELYNVALYANNGVRENITVDNEFPSGGNYYDHTSTGVLWVALAEKAYAQANGAGIVSSNSPRNDSYSALNSGWPSWALHAVSGQAAADYQTTNFNGIANAWVAGDFTVLTSSATPRNSGIVGSPKEGTHAYAVVGYSPSSSSPYEIYNPWGATYSQNGILMAPGTFDGHAVYGLFNASAAFLSQNFAVQSNGASAAVTTNDHPQQAADAVVAAWHANAPQNGPDLGSKHVSMAYDAVFAEWPS